MQQSLCLQMMVGFDHLALSKQSLMRLSDTDAVAVPCDPDDRMDPVLQDCISEHSSLTKAESDPQDNLSLPGEKTRKILNVQISTNGGKVWE